MTFWSCDLTRSYYKLKPLYLHYQRAHGHQTRQDCNLLWWDPAHKITWHFDYVSHFDHLPLNWEDGHLPWGALAHKITRFLCRVVLQDQVTNWKHISATTIPMANKHDRMVTENEELWSIVSYDPSFTCSYKVTWHIKYVISPLALDQ